MTLLRKNLATPEEIKKKYKIDFNKPIILFTQHSVTTEHQMATKQIIQSLEALTKAAKKGIQVIITYPNNDAGGIEIIKKLKIYTNKNYKNIKLYKSLGRYDYHGFLNLATLKDIKIICAGNSSSGIKETPAFGCPTINIGSRQNSRLRGNNVIDVDYNSKKILLAIEKCLTNKSFIEKCTNTTNPYGIGNSGIKIANFCNSKNR